MRGMTEAATATTPAFCKKSWEHRTVRENLALRRSPLNCFLPDRSPRRWWGAWSPSDRCLWRTCWELFLKEQKRSRAQRGFFFGVINRRAGLTDGVDVKEADVSAEDGGEHAVVQRLRRLHQAVENDQTPDETKDHSSCGQTCRRTQMNQSARFQRDRTQRHRGERPGYPSTCRGRRTGGNRQSGSRWSHPPDWRECLCCWRTPPSTCWSTKSHFCSSHVEVEASVCAHQ